MKLGGPTRKAATGKLSRLEALIHRGTPADDAISEVFGGFNGSKITFRDAAGPYLTWAKNRKKTSTLHRDTCRMKLLMNAPWAGKYLGKIKPEDIARWLSERERTGKGRGKESGLSGPALNRDLALISALYQWAIVMGYASENPARRIPRHSEAGRERETYLEPGEATALVQAAEQAFRPVLLAALHTGMRRGELIALRWQAVDFARREIVVEPETAKSKKTRVIPLPHDLEPVLRRLRQSRKVSRPDGADPVFTLEEGTAITGDMIRGMMRRALRNCDAIPQDKKPRVTFHCLRHTSASFMAQGGASLFEIAKILGHGSLAMTMRYAHFCPQRGKSAVEGVGQFLSTSGQLAAGSA